MEAQTVCMRYTAPDGWSSTAAGHMRYIREHPPGGWSGTAAAPPGPAWRPSPRCTARVSCCSWSQCRPVRADRWQSKSGVGGRRWRAVIGANAVMSDRLGVLHGRICSSLHSHPLREGLLLSSPPTLLYLLPLPPRIPHTLMYSTTLAGPYTAEARRSNSRFSRRILSLRGVGEWCGTVVRKVWSDGKARHRK